MRSFTKKNQNALVLIPCCKQKSVYPFQGQFQQPLHDLESLRNQYFLIGTSFLPGQIGNMLKNKLYYHVC